MFERSAGAPASFVVTVGNVDPDVTTAARPAVIGQLGDPIHVDGRITDPGRDDITSSWQADDGSPDEVQVSLVNPPGTDPDPSSSVQPRDVGHDFDRFDVEQERAHTLIELGHLDEALASVQRLMSLDVELSGEETSEPFCAAADYFRARGDHQVAVQMLANMLDGREPGAPVHRRVIQEGSIALGATFDAVWARGRRMTPASLHAIVREEF